jgi:uncharacterized membrane protein
MPLRSKQPHPLVRKYPRATGFVVLLIGLAFFHVSIAGPILYAKAGEVIKLSGKGGIGGSIFIILGLFLILLGPRLMAWNQASAESSRRQALVLGVLFGILVIVAMEVTKSYLRGKGYILP